MTDDTRKGSHTDDSSDQLAAKDELARGIVGHRLTDGKTYEDFLETNRPIVERGIAGLKEMLARGVLK